MASFCMETTLTVLLILMKNFEYTGWLNIKKQDKYLENGKLPFCFTNKIKTILLFTLLSRSSWSCAWKTKLQNSTVQCCIVQYCTEQYNTVLHSTEQYITEQYRTEIYRKNNATATSFFSLMILCWFCIIYKYFARISIKSGKSRD